MTISISSLGCPLVLRMQKWFTPISYVSASWYICWYLASGHIFVSSSVRLFVSRLLLFKCCIPNYKEYEGL